MSLLVRNARVVELPSSRSGPDPVDLLIDAGRIVEIAPRIAAGAAAVVDVEGAFVSPGLVDAHTHLEWAAQDFWSVPWSDAPGAGTALARLREVLARVGPDEWLGGGGWTSGAERGLPSLAELDAVCPRSPLLLHSADGGSLVLNSEALRRCRIEVGNDPTSAPGIERDGHGRATGRVTGAAARDRAVHAVVPPRNRRRSLAELRSLLADLARRGVTEVHDIAARREPDSHEPVYLERSHTDLALIEALRDADELPVRVGFRVPALRAVPPADLDDDPGGLVFAQGVKLFLDDGWTSSSATRVDEYRYPGRDAARALLTRAAAAGLPATVHALGDRGVAEAIDVLTGLPALPGGRRHRIAHARLIARADIARLAAQHLVVETQPYEVVGAAGWSAPVARAHPDVLADPHHALLAAGVELLFSTDRRLGMRPDLADADPWEGMRTAVHRGDGARRLDPEQAITPGQALAAYSSSGARLAGGGPSRGAVRVGRAADLVFCDVDPLSALAAGTTPTVLGTLCAGRFSFTTSGLRPC